MDALDCGDLVSTFDHFADLGVVIRTDAGGDGISAALRQRRTCFGAGLSVAPSLSAMRIASATPSPVAARRSLTACTLSPLAYRARTFAASAGSMLTCVGSTRERALLRADDDQRHQCRSDDDHDPEPDVHPHIVGSVTTSSAMPPQRIAISADTPQIAALMRASVLSLFPQFYNDQQTASAAVHIAHLDQSLIDDGTYFVHEWDGEIVACGGWSKRDRLYAGSGDRCRRRPIARPGDRAGQGAGDVRPR